MLLSFFHLFVCCLGYFLCVLRAQNTFFGTATSGRGLSMMKVRNAGHRTVSKRLNLLIFNILCLFPVFLNAQSDATPTLLPALTCQIQGKFDTLRLPPLQWILEEGEQALSYEKLLAGELADARILDLKGSALFPIKAHRGYWFKIRLTASSKPDAFGLIFYRNGDCWPFEPTFKEVQTFSIGQNGKTFFGHSGSTSPASKRDYPNYLLPSMIRGNIEAGETLDIWCKVTMAEPCNLQVDLELVREKIILSPLFTSSEQVAANVFVGASIALWLFAALLLVWIKKPVYVWFFIFQSAVLLNGVFAFHRNEIYNLLFRENPRGVIFFMLVANIFQVTALFQLGRVYVGTKLRFPKAHFILGTCILFYLLTLIFGTISRFILEAPNGIWFQIRAIFVAVVYGANILGVLLLLFSKDKLALFFCLGAVMPIISLAYRIYELTLSESPRNSGFNLVHASGMVLAMAFALAYRFRLEIKEKESALKDKINAELEKTEQQLRMNLAAEETQRLSELDRIKTNFFSNITHEFRTPLTLMIEPLRRVLPKIKDAEVLENVQLAEKNSRQLLGLVNQLLDMAKIESGQMGLDLRQADMGETVRGVFERFLPLAEKRGIKLTLSAPGTGLPPFAFDKGKVELILNNLISNALKFTPEGGKVGVGIYDLRFTSGDLRFTRDDLRFTSGDLRFTRDDLRFTSGDLRFTRDDLRFTSGDLRFTSGDLRFTSDDLRFTSGDLRFTSDDLRFTSEDLRVGSEDLRFTNDDLRFRSDDLGVTSGDGGLASKVGENTTSDLSEATKNPEIQNPEIRNPEIWNPEIRNPKSEIAIRVSDTGIGIPPDQLDKIFDRFYQVDGSHTRAGEGTGIGLALSKELAELMGGRILVESEAGKGSTFTFVIPTAEVAGATTTAPAALVERVEHKAMTATTKVAPKVARAEAPVVLIVEDNTELRHFIKSAIGENWQVVEASDGEEGLKKALDLVPDLVVSDLMMPRKDGLSLLDELKAHELTAHIPVILLTSKSAIESKLKGLQHGADDYLTKPFSTEELLARMENLVENRRRLREIYSHPGAGLTAAISGVSGGTSAAFLSGPDREFLQKFLLLLEKHLADETLGVEDFAQKLFISRVQLHRKLKALTDRSATDFIRDYRLECALTMLKNREGRVGEVALRVGFGNEKYFSTAFKEKYGVSPSQV